MKAYELLDKPEKWTQGAYAKDANGRIVSALSPEATCWDVSGAAYRAYGDWKIALSILERLYSVTQKRTPVWNDAPERTWLEVYTLLKELDV
jgi:hypothetical protein